MTPVIRYLGFAFLAIAAFAVFVVLKPQVPTESPTLPTATTYETLISTALSDFNTNDENADTAPKQQVVNGWVARDLLTIIAKQNVDILKSQGAIVDATGTLNTTPFDERIPALLLIGVLAIVWGGLSAPAAPPRAVAPSEPLPPGSVAT